MSSSTTTTAPALVPTITGDQVRDTNIRNTVQQISGVATGLIIAWLASHGVNETAGAALGISLTTLISGLIASVLTQAAAFAWGWWASNKSRAALINNVVHAATTGEVAAAIIAKATPEQAAAVQASPIASVSPTPSQM